LSPVVLNADDYALTAGICDGILALAEAGRLSSTSAMVNMPHWPTRAGAAVALRQRIALGLHLNLTFGQPLEPMPEFAPSGSFSSFAALARRAFGGGLPAAEIRAEISRQIDRFSEVAGHAPEFVDGHHHVHVLPGIREALIAVMKLRYPGGGPLLRDPADRLSRIVRRGIAVPKALTAAALARGFRRCAEGAGFAVNDGFAGFSTFGRVPYATEFQAFWLAPGTRPIIMCHPGFADDELGDRDSIAARRPEEQRVLADFPRLPDMIWHPQRTANASEFPW